MTVKRFRPICEFVEYDMPIAKMAECPDGYVRGEDYDATAWLICTCRPGRKLRTCTHG